MYVKLLTYLLCFMCNFAQLYFNMLKQTNKELEIAAKEVIKNKFNAVTNIEKDAMAAFLNLLSFKHLRRIN